MGQNPKEGRESDTSNHLRSKGKCNPPSRLRVELPCRLSG